MHTTIRFAVSALMALTLQPTPSSANELPTKVQIAVIDNIPSANAAQQLLEAAYQRLNIHMTTLHVPSRRALLMADNGDLDGDLFRIDSVAEAYPNLLRVPFPLLNGKLHAVVRDPGISQLPASSAESPLKVAILRGVIIAEKTADALGMEPVHAENYDQIRTLLELNRVDLAFVADIEGITPLANDAWAGLHALPNPIVTFTLHHYLNQRHVRLAGALADVLAQLEREGVKSGILKSVRGE
ncbi:hypothetical protein KUV44_03655 [Marinobacter daepoensis]|uniref:Solute-binding protein family 3/N-terminal domain-containing protein n=1 Tax=Marinobacter daepoensis TaxID=262077 RepID=A0ABS3BH19_9GAMM|nr:hypothetical protein [Marinobacter daepoensis]MBN7769535.1 hypothetical protein [Marinobacter daepoensis]MBY6031804.1 hypothetical protein [Marinobacter daepoensis]MBY6078225.1 hypothetical protein [Marinobacter daepoensis]